jgi:hypothetical protein
LLKRLRTLLAARARVRAERQLRVAESAPDFEPMRPFPGLLLDIPAELRPPQAQPAAAPAVLSEVTS